MAKGAMKGLSKAQIRRFKNMLEAKAEEIRQNLQSAKAAKALARGEEPVGIEELPGQSHEEWIFLNRNNIDAMLFREIHEALGRIEETGFGICLECDEGISLKRLQVIPWARCCVTCQEELAGYLEEPTRQKRSYSY